MSGKPIVWSSGQVSYYTDQGDLSALLPQASANLFVADAFSRWTSVPAAALTATRGGALAEDVSGSNVVVNGSVVTLPTDIQPTSTKPVAIVYDSDGRVVDTLLGTGASDPSLCATNSVLGGIDRMSQDAHIAHALLIINGRCAQASPDLVPLKYHLVRAIGQVLGLGWSQTNDNVITNSPFPGSADYAGLSLMHPMEPFCVGAITTCIPNADQLRMDDRAAIARLYPITVQNLGSFPGKQVLAASTIRIHGSIYFPGVTSNAGQPMQGVNVVARLIDPNSGLPSRSAVASSVSGFLFRGNAGNPVSGFGSSQRFDAFGGADASLEGFFDLAGLEVPNGQSSATFQITLESIDPLYRDDTAVGPYTSGIVTPSGATQPIVLMNLSAGADVAQDIIVNGAAITRPNAQTLVQQPVPVAGDWWGTLAGYGRTEFYRMPAQAKRTIGLSVTAVDETLHPTDTKLQPELGLWLGANPLTTLPQSRADSFNGPANESTVLVAPINTAGSAQVGLADYRGDGRPDFIYHAHLLYADTLTPARITTSGGTLQIKGIGFQQGMAVTVGGSAATVLSQDANSIFIQAPSLAAGTKSIFVQDASSGLSTTMTDVLSVGVVTGDKIIPIAVTNAAVPVGAIAPNALRFRVVAADGVTPVPGATVNVSVSPTASRITACNASTCTLTSDGSGEVDAFVFVNTAGVSTVTASLSNGQLQQGTLFANTSLMLTTPTAQIRIPSGTSTSIFLPIQMLSGGVGVAGGQVTYTITSGSGTLSTSSVTTDANGKTPLVSFTVTNFTSSATVNACTPTVPCVQFAIFPVVPSSIVLQVVSGDAQMIAVGQSFQPVVLRVLDTANPPNVLAGIPVTITGAVFASSQPDCAPDTGICRPTMPRAFSNFSVTLTSNAVGTVSYTPTVQPGWGAVQVGIIANAGSSASQNVNLQVFAPSQ